MDDLTPEEIKALEKKNQRIKDYSNRLNSLKDINGLARLLEWNVRNPKKVALDDIKQDSEAKLLELESKVEELKAEQDQKEQIRVEKDNNKKAAKAYLKNLDVDNMNASQVKTAVKHLVRLFDF